MQVAVVAGKSRKRKKNVDITGRMCYNTMNHNVDQYAYLRVEITNSFGRCRNVE